MKFIKVKQFWARAKENKFFSRVSKIIENNPQILTVVLIVGLAAFFRFWQINVIPGGFSERERETVQHLIDLNKNRLWLGSQFDKAAYLYTAYLWTKIFGLSIIALRFLSATIGTLTVVALYAFIAKWFSKKIAIFSAFLLSISAFHVGASRLIVPDIMLPLILLLVFSLLTMAFRTKNIWLFGIAGFCIGLGFYTSTSFLFVPILFGISGLYFFLVNKKFLTSYKNEIIVSAIAFLGSSFPFLISFFTSPMNYLTNFGFNRSLWQVVMNVGQIPNMLFLSTQGDFFYSLGTEPIMDPFIFVTSVSGFLLALFAISRRKYFFLVFWFILFILYGAMKRGVQIGDLFGLVPVLFVFSALILDYVLDMWFKTFPYNKTARVLIVGIVAALFSISALYNFDRYYIGYKSASEVKKEFSAKPPIPLK